ncbi:hypothetical protein TWF281_004129 [Arthrobotrys megalospora]
MLSPSNLGKLALVLLVVADAVIEASPIVSTTGDSKALSVMRGSNAPALSKRQATAEQLSQLTRAFGGDIQSTRTGPGRPEAQSLSTTSDLVRKEPIHPSFFYSERGLYVRCNSPEFAYNLKPWTSPDYLHIIRDDWINWLEKAGSVEAAIKLIRIRQSACYSCKCNDQGKIIQEADPRDHPLNCGRFRADKCAMMLACFCTVDLIQPTATSLSATVADYQNALDAIPPTARGQNENYAWLWGGSSLTFSNTDLRLADGRRVVINRPRDPLADEVEDMYGEGFRSLVLDPDNGYGLRNLKEKWSGPYNYKRKYYR